MRKMDLVLKDVLAEYISAHQKFTAYASLHEGYAVILEELDELWAEIKKRSKDRSSTRLYEEAIQVASTACALALFVRENQ